jgi:Uma2 family endonuclease
MGGVTMTSPLARPAALGPWTVQDLRDLPDDGYRYEVFDGSLLVSPPPPMPHFNTVYRLRRILERQAPDGIVIGENLGVRTRKDDRTLYIPDLVVFDAALLAAEVSFLEPTDVLVAIEVISPKNAGHDLILKRHEYASARIAEYWIADGRAGTLSILAADSEPGRYVSLAEATPGAPWRSGYPFPLRVDPGEIF